MKTKKTRDFFLSALIGLAILTAPLLLAAGCGEDPKAIAEREKVLMEKRRHKGNLLSIAQVGEKQLWAVGARGLILHSPDRGKTWEIQESPSNRNLNDIFFENEKTGVIVGEKSTILETQDGGKKWTMREIKKECNLLTLANTDECLYAVGDFGTIIARKKTGTEWEDKSLAEDQIITGVHFINNQKGWICGEFGMLMTTNSGGAEWSKIETLPTALEEPFLYSVNFINENTGIVTTPGRKIFLTEDGCQTWKEFQTDSGEAYDSCYLNGMWYFMGKCGVEVMQKNSQKVLARPESFKKVAEIGMWVRKAALGEGGKEAWFAGSNGTILHLNGDTWEKIHP